MFTAAALLFTLLAARCALALATGTEAGGLEGELDGSGGGGGGGGSEGGGGGEGGGGTVIGGWVLADTWTDAEAALALLGTRALWTDWRLEVSFYLARLLFALSALPFVLFELPGLQALLLHTHPTG